MIGDRWASVATEIGGKRPVSPLQGFGRMWQKTYRVRVGSVAPEELIVVWKERFPDFWPEGNRMKLSTGWTVLYADDESFTLRTPQGHMFAGWITFSARVEDGETVAQAQVLMRACDPIYELGLTFGGHSQENRFWEHTLTQVAAHFGREAEVDTQVVCVDRRRQWARWRNVRRSAALRARPGRS